MRYLPTGLILVGIPLYVFSAFVADVFIPTSSSSFPSQETLTISFVGDMMFDRYIRYKATLVGYDAILADTLALFDTSTLIIGNLEGPITDFASVSNWNDAGPNHYRFTFATTVAETLAYAGFSAVSLANNHVLNFGEEGLAQTQMWLSSKGIGFFGHKDNPYDPWRYATGSVPVALYAFDSWYARDAEELVRRISQEPVETFVIVFAHWGDEYIRTPTPGQQELAKKFIDAGADFVTGSHPHVIQTKERYNEKWIYYSLGNFVFDQYFNEDVACGAVLTLSIAPDGTYDVKEQFVRMERDGTTRPSDCIQGIPGI